MGKSAKFHKRPTRKEKMGLSSHAHNVRAAIASSKFNRPEPTIVPKHESKVSLAQKSDHKPYSLIQDPIEETQLNTEMEVDEAPNKKKRKDLKSKLNKRSKSNSDQSLDPAPDYVDLYEKLDPRKSKNSNK